MKTACSLIVGFMLSSLRAESYDPFDPHLNAPMMVRIQIEFIQVDQSDYLELVSPQTPTADATALRKKLQQMVQDKQATVLETAMVNARGGEMASVESVHEFIFPTDYELSGTFPKKLEKSIIHHQSLSRMLGIPHISTAFEIRNLGTSFEVAPNISAQNRIIDLQFVPELVELNGFSVHERIEDLDGEVHERRRPEFGKQSLSTALTCINGQYHLAGITTPTKDKGQPDPNKKVMSFIKCDILPVVTTPAKK